MQQLQDMDERRGCRLQGFIKQSAEIEKAVVPIINTCIDGITQAASSINPSEVSYRSTAQISASHLNTLNFEGLTEKRI